MFQKTQQSTLTDMYMTRDDYLRMYSYMQKKYRFNAWVFIEEAGYFVCVLAATKLGENETLILENKYPTRNPVPGRIFVVNGDFKVSIDLLLQGSGLKLSWEIRWRNYFDLPNPELIIEGEYPIGKPFSLRSTTENMLTFNPDEIKTETILNMNVWDFPCKYLPTLSWLLEVLKTLAGDVEHWMTPYTDSIREARRQYLNELEQKRQDVLQRQLVIDKLKHVLHQMIREREIAVEHPKRWSDKLIDRIVLDDRYGPVIVTGRNAKGCIKGFAMIHREHVTLKTKTPETLFIAREHEAEVKIITNRVEQTGE